METRAFERLAAFAAETLSPNNPQTRVLSDSCQHVTLNNAEGLPVATLSRPYRMGETGRAAGLFRLAAIDGQPVAYFPRNPRHCDVAKAIRAFVRAGAGLADMGAEELAEELADSLARETVNNETAESAGFDTFRASALCRAARAARRAEIARDMLAALPVETDHMSESEFLAWAEARDGLAEAEAAPERLKPGAADCARIRGLAKAQSRAFTGRADVSLEAGIRYNLDSGLWAADCNCLHVTRFESHGDSDLADFASWADFRAGFELVKGRAVVDFYVRNGDGLACNLVCLFDRAGLCAVYGSGAGGPLLWARDGFTGPGGWYDGPADPAEPVDSAEAEAAPEACPCPDCGAADLARPEPGPLARATLAGAEAQGRAIVAEELARAFALRIRPVERPALGRAARALADLESLGLDLLNPEWRDVLDSSLGFGPAARQSLPAGQPVPVSEVQPMTTRLTLSAGRPEPQTAPKSAAMTLDLTPTWAAIMPALVAALQHGTPEGQRLAAAELESLAAKVDAMNRAAKAWADLAADLAEARDVARLALAAILPADLATARRADLARMATDLRDSLAALLAAQSDNPETPKGL